MGSPDTDTARDLRALFEPRSVALIGASADPESIGARPLRLLLQHGYAGGLYPVNPKYTALHGLKVYPAVAAIPEPVDLALVMVPAPVVVDVLEECAAAGVRCAIVITSGFAESGHAGRELQRQIAAVAERTGLRVCGPNSEGVYNPANRLCATFSPAVDPQHGFEAAPAGPIAIVSQSGGLAFALLNHAQDRGLAVGAVVSTGNEVDLGWADYVDYLLDQPGTRVVLSFVEAFRQAGRLVGIARKAARLRKPLLIAKIGRTAVGGRAAASHTASLVGTDAAFSAAFRQLGLVRVDDVDEMLDLAAYFSVGRLPAGRRTAVLTASGGAGAWLADLCAARGLALPAPAPADQDAIRAFIPHYGSVHNPVDITAQAALSGGFERALGLLAQSSAFDVVLAVGTLVREERFFQTLPDLKAAIVDSRAAVVYYTYTRASRTVVATLAASGIPCFSTPGRTARAVSAAADYADFLGRVGGVAALQDGFSGWSERPAPEQRHTPGGQFGNASLWPVPDGPLSEAGSRAYLEPLGLSSPADGCAASADAAVACWEALGGGPVALKVQSPDFAHKSDVGGVRLGLRTAADVAAAFADILAATRAARPDAVIEGVLVQRMAPEGVEAFVGVRREPGLGPLVVVGVGGLEVEALGNVAMRLAPVSLAEARDMLDEVKGLRLARGTRGRQAMDVEALAAAVVRISEMAVALPSSVAAVEVNPLLVLPAGLGVLMLDAAVEVEFEVKEESRV